MPVEQISRLRVDKIIKKAVFDFDNAIGHSCDHWETVCVLKGDLRVVISDRIYNLGSGAAAFFAPKEFHSIKSNADTQYLFIEFIAEGEPLNKLAGGVVSLSEREQSLADYLCNISEDAEDTIVYQRLCTTLELLLLHCCTKEQAVPSVSQKDAELYAKAVEILKQNIPFRLSVTQLAEKLSISLSHLKRIFTQYTSVGVHEYFTFLRIDRAKEMLLNGETVTRTAELTGFTNQAYFSSAFKRVCGISPKEFAGNIKTVRPEKLKRTSQVTKQESLPSYLL